MLAIQRSQELLLQELITGHTSNKFEFEREFEEEKFDIIFEKAMLEQIESHLSKDHLNRDLDNNKDLLDLYHDLIGLSEVDEKFVQALRRFDATGASFRFVKKQAKHNLAKSESIEELHKLFRSTSDPLIRLLIDWICATKQIKTKVEKIRESFE